MSLAKYLKYYAESSCHSGLLSRFDRVYDHVIVIPACDEEPDFVEQLAAQAFPGSFLLVLVINQPANSTENGYRGNRLLMDYLHQHFKQLDHCPEEKMILFQLPANNSPQQNGLLAIDRFSPGLELDPKHGVGLARKIGTDIAVALIASRIISSPYIHSTDADTRLPASYFFNGTSQGDRLPAARICQFMHEADDSIVGLSTLLYEISLRYYVHALKFARSPYAFFTIGSTLCFHHARYAEVRGFPKRNAGEDFYLLNKLAKTGDIQLDPGTSVRISARFSDRVPFGTGPATKKISLFSRPLEEYLYYHPAIFCDLKHLLTLFTRLHDDQKSLNQLAPRIRETLHAIGFEKALSHARNNSNSPHHFCRHLQQWFDGFRTLKFVHHLRDHHLPSVPLRQLLELGGLSGLWPENTFELPQDLSPDDFKVLEKINLQFSSMLAEMPTDHIHQHAQREHAPDHPA